MLDVTAVTRIRERSREGLRIRLPLPDGVEAYEVVHGTYTQDVFDATVGQGGEAVDLVGTFWASIYLISTRLREFLEREKLTGWRSVPVNVAGRQDLDLHVLVVRGRCGRVVDDLVDDSGRPVFGEFVRPQEWDGSDFFSFENRATVYVTGDCAARLEAGGFANLALEPAALEAIP